MAGVHLNRLPQLLTDTSFIELVSRSGEAKSYVYITGFNLVYLNKILNEFSCISLLK